MRLESLTTDDFFQACYHNDMAFFNTPGMSEYLEQLEKDPDFYHTDMGISLMSTSLFNALRFGSLDVADYLLEYTSLNQRPNFIHLLNMTLSECCTTSQLKGLDYILSSNFLNQYHSDLDIWSGVSGCYERNFNEALFMLASHPQAQVNWELGNKSRAQPIITGLTSLYQCAYHDAKMDIIEYMIQNSLILKSELVECVFESWPKPYSPQIRDLFRVQEEKNMLEKSLRAAPPPNKMVLFKL